MKTKESALCYKSTAIDILGITANEFDRLNIPVEDTVSNPHHKSSSAYLYNRKLIKRYAKRKSIIKIRERLFLLRAKKEANKDANRIKKEKRLAAAEERTKLAAILLEQNKNKKFDEYQVKYPTLQAAVSDASKAMLNLNRFAKHADCDKDTRASIYDMKNRFVRMLYLNGYCTGASKHILRIDKKECWSCGGTGFHESGDDCNKCEGTGIYREPRDVVYVLFAFSINGSNYSWHQPDDKIGFNVAYTMPSADMPDIGVKPLEIPASELTEAQWLLQWVVNKWGQDSQFQSNCFSDQGSVCSSPSVILANAG